MKDNPQAERLFREGLQEYRFDYKARALVKFRQAVELDKHNPVYISYLGLLVGLVQQKHTEALKLCEQAVRMKRNEPRLYLNLAEVCLKAGKKGDAVETLTTGLQYTKRDPKLWRALNKLGVRRSPVITGLDRSHFLNKHLGRLRHRLLNLLVKE